jgi:hypothetical protein
MWAHPTKLGATLMLSWCLAIGHSTLYIVTTSCVCGCFQTRWRNKTQELRLDYFFLWNENPAIVFHKKGIDEPFVPRKNWSHSIERSPYPENAIRSSAFREIASKGCNITENSILSLPLKMSSMAQRHLSFLPRAKWITATPRLLFLLLPSPVWDPTSSSSVGSPYFELPDPNRDLACADGCITRLVLEKDSASLVATCGSQRAPAKTMMVRCTCCPMDSFHRLGWWWRGGCHNGGSWHMLSYDPNSVSQEKGRLLTERSEGPSPVGLGRNEVC